MNNNGSKTNFDNFRLKDFFVCPNCNVVLKLDDNIFRSYFYSGNVNCFNCDEPIDLWITFRKLLDQNSLIFGYHYSLVGCINKHNTIKIKPNEVTRLDLSKEIGEGELLYINYTPGPGGTFPIEIHSNTPVSYLNRQNKLIYGKPNNSDAKETNINVFYWFAPEEIKNDLSSMLLLDAFKFFFEDNYRYMIISAHSSVEIILSKFIEKILNEYGISKNQIEKITKKIDTSVQLDILLPFICNLLDFAILDEKIVDGLKKLRNDRNNLIHNGETKISDKTTLKIELISAFLAYKYLKLHNEINFF